LRNPTEKDSVFVFAINLTPLSKSFVCTKIARLGNSKVSVKPDKTNITKE